MSGGTEGKEENGLGPETKPEESDSQPEPKPQGKLKPPGIVIVPNRALRVKNSRVTSLNFAWPPSNNNEYYYDVVGCPICDYFGKELCGLDGCAYSHARAHPEKDQKKRDDIIAEKKGDQELRLFKGEIMAQLNEMKEFIKTQTTPTHQTAKARTKRRKQQEEQEDSEEEEAAKIKPKQLTSNFLRTLQLAAVLFRTQGRPENALRLYADTFNMSLEYKHEDLVDLFGISQPMADAVNAFKKSGALIRQSHLAFKDDAALNRAFATTLYLTLWFAGDRQLVIEHFINAREGHDGLKRGAYTAESFLKMEKFEEARERSLPIFESMRTDIIRRTGAKFQDSSDSETRVEAEGGSTMVTFKKSAAENTLPKDMIKKLFQPGPMMKDEEMHVTLQMPESTNTTMCAFGLREDDSENAIVGANYMADKEAMCITSGNNLFISLKISNEVNATIVATLLREDEAEDPCAEGAGTATGEDLCDESLLESLSAGISVALSLPLIGCCILRCCCHRLLGRKFPLTASSSRSKVATMVALTSLLIFNEMNKLSPDVMHIASLSAI